jgi:hypothetical protein
MREGHLRRKYGIDQESYLQRLAAQGGCCAICEKPAESERDGKLRVDHCHSTGKIRGLLCDSCNVGLGKFGDNIDSLTVAIMYLRQN